MNRGTIVIVHSDPSAFSDLSSALRASGYCVFRADARAVDIGDAFPALGAHAAVIEKSAVGEGRLAAAVSRLFEASHIERIVVIGEFSPDEASLLSRRGVTPLRPPFQLERLFAALDIPDERPTEYERLRGEVYFGIDSLLATLGITRDMAGYKPIRETLFCMITAGRQTSLSAEAYPRAAAALSTSAYAVERAVRLTVSEVWDDILPSARAGLIPSADINAHPTNKLFLTALADRLRRGLHEELERLGSLQRLERLEPFGR